MQGGEIQGIQEPDCSKHSLRKREEGAPMRKIRGKCDCNPLLLKCTHEHHTIKRIFSN